MNILYDAPGQTCRITVTEAYSTRTLLLDGCEEGAMNLASEEPVFGYLWFHKCSHLADHPIQTALVLGAGAFTAAKCLARDHPQAEIDTVDVEPVLEKIGRQFFRLDRPDFSRIRFHGVPAENFLKTVQPGTYDFIFDDLFDGFQHVPIEAMSADHLRHLCSALEPGGVCIKNMIWDPFSASSRAGCAELQLRWMEALPNHLILAMGEADRGHNLLLLGSKGDVSLTGPMIKARLTATGMPASIVNGIHCKSGPE
jgi:spermidine synthase